MFHFSSYGLDLSLRRNRLKNMDEHVNLAQESLLVTNPSPARSDGRAVDRLAVDIALTLVCL